MLSRRALVGKFAAGAAGAAVAWAAGGGRTKVALARGQANPLMGSAPGAGEMGAAGDDRLVPTAEGSAASLEPLPAPAAVAPVEATAAEVPATATAPPPWELVQPLALGAEVAHGWRVTGLTGVVDGVCVLTLQNGSGRVHRVHLCRNDGRPQGLVYTDRLDLVVMNGGQGDLPTEEGLAQAVAEVAHVLAANERERDQQRLVAELQPHAERVRLYAATAGAHLR